MPEAVGYLKQLLGNLKAIRERAGLTEGELERRLILGPGWIARFENGGSVPGIDILLAILHETETPIADLLQGLPELDASAAELERCIFAEHSGDDIVVHFRYAKFDAQYVLENGTLSQFEAVIKILRDGLAKTKAKTREEAETIKTNAVANAFLAAVNFWPEVNPSDLWWFIIYRAYCDPYNHPARFARLDFTQSWKRTGGWALEVILARHYGPFLKERGVILLVPDDVTKQGIVNDLNLEHRVEADKIDVVLLGETSGGPIFFGIVNVKASFAERRTDDVPLSEAFIEAGFASPLWTMDCKSTPGVHPKNRGELGTPTGKRSAKRKDIEDQGYFTGCFSYNRNTQQTPDSLAPERRVYVCDFRSADDAFSRFILSRWQTFQAQAGVDSSLS